MIPVPSEIEGKQARFGHIEEPFQTEGFVLGGNWDYKQGYFDCALEQENAETIFLRLPVEVVEGELDDRDARLKFQQPLLVRHVINPGLGDDSVPLIDQMPGGLDGLVNQFQEPLEQDGEIKNAELRVAKARAAISKIMPYIQ